MATLEDVGSGQIHPLPSRYVIGRRPPCHLLLENSRVSGLHAEVLWDGRQWVLQDLGSRNGTFIDGRRLVAGERALLTLGSELAFGIRTICFRVLGLEPPQLMARSTQGEVVIADGELLCLPSADAPDVTIFLDAVGVWQLESSDSLRPIGDGAIVSLGEEAWTIHIPDESQSTSEIREERRSLADVALHIFVSRDGEHVACQLRFPLEGIAQKLEPRAHNMLLLILARARVMDREQTSLPETEHGWVHREDILRMLKIDFTLLNVWVYRARQQWHDAGVTNSALLVERRAGSQQVRLGISNIMIETP